MAAKQTKLQEPTTMEELLAKYGSKVHGFHQGQRIQAVLTRLEKNFATFDVGGKSEGVVAGSYFDEARDYLKNLKIGKSIEATVMEPETPDGTVRLSLRQTAMDSLWDRLESAYDSGDEVDVVVRNVTEKGIAVEFDTILGFIPLSQLGKKALKDLAKLPNTKLSVRVIDIDRLKKRVLFSEKAVSEAEEIELAHMAMESLKEGETYEAKVVQVTNFGIFVEVSAQVNKKEVPLEGLVHISELAWEKIEDASGFAGVGEKVTVKLIGKKEDKLAFSIKQASKDPWSDISDRYTTETKVKGKVVRVSSFGVFVEIEPGIEGLIHLTKIPPGTSFEVGDKVDCYIEEVNAADRRISLGLILTAKPVGYK